MEMIGSTLRQYRIVEKIGSGGMGTVYRAVDTRLERPVAVKVLAPGAIGNPDRKRRFFQEARTASALQHPNIIAIYDADTADVAGQRVDFIVMELVSGDTLEELIAGRGLRAKVAV